MMMMMNPILAVFVNRFTLTALKRRK